MEIDEVEKEVLKEIEELIRKKFQLKMAFLGQKLRMDMLLSLGFINVG